MLDTSSNLEQGLVPTAQELEELVYGSESQPNVPPAVGQTAIEALLQEPDTRFTPPEGKISGTAYSMPSGDQ